MRQTGIRIILLCTGILMLVLSVLPHHHHCDGSIRFSVVEQCTECYYVYPDLSLLLSGHGSPVDYRPFVAALHGAESQGPAALRAPPAFIA